MQPKVTKGETLTFSKYILNIVVSLYFLGALLGTILIVVAAVNDMKLGSPVDSSMFIAYATYLGGPTATAIGFYAWKSKAENIIKIGKSFPDLVNTIVETEEQE